jgi:hypothetical protein
MLTLSLPAAKTASRTLAEGYSSRCPEATPAVHRGLSPVSNGREVQQLSLSPRLS